MCGIFGYIGKNDPLTSCLEGLKLLEYRGYDSAGVAGIFEGNLFCYKAAGKIESLEKKILPVAPKLEIAIAHTRWATHGQPTDINAHPHLDEKGTVAVIHNGIIENYSALRKELMDSGVFFKSDTDTEVVPQLIAKYYKGDFLEAVFETIKRLKGTFAFAIIHKNHPDQIIAASRESPLVIGYDDKGEESMVASDANAFLGRKLNIIFLKKDELAVIKKGTIEIYDQKKRPISPKAEKLDCENIIPQKEGFEHFMLKEIFEQPLSIQRALTGRISEEFGTVNFEDFTFSNEELMAINHILIIACGTSWHAGSIAALAIEDIARIPTQAEIASELRYQNPIISNQTLVIAISQSGETADTIGALREVKAKGAKVLGICNTKNSTIARESDCTILLKAGPEISVCSTKAFTSQIAVLTLFAILMARLRHMSKQDGQLFLQEVKTIPKVVKEILDRSPELASLAKKYASYSDFFFIGRRYMYPTCLEAALKLKEISYINATGYAAGEMKHGPIALLSEKFPVVAFCANDQTFSKITSNLMEVKARRAPLLAFATEGSPNIKNVADDVFFLPHLRDELSVFPASVAGQLFAYYIAKERGTNIDQPRNLAKSVTVE